MSSPESRPDYAKLAQDARRFPLWRTSASFQDIARALQSCAADLAAAKSEADNSHYWYEEARRRLAKAEQERDEAIAQADDLRGFVVAANQDAGEAEAELEREQAEHVECELVLERAEAELADTKERLEHGIEHALQLNNELVDCREAAGSLHLLYSLAIDYEREHGNAEQADRMIEALAKVPDPRYRVTKETQT